MDMVEVVHLGKLILVYIFSFQGGRDVMVKRLRGKNN